MNSRIVRIGLALIAVAMIVILARYGASQIVALSTRIEGLGALAPLVFIGAFAVAGALFVPASILTMTAGVLFGLGLGFLCAFSGALLGALLSFSVARYGIRGIVERRLRAHPKTSSVINAVGENGLKVAALLRLSPVIPYNLINVTMAVTPISFLRFALSCSAMLPVTLLYVYYGTVAGTIARAQKGHEHRSAADYSILAAGLIVTLIVTLYVSRLAKTALAATSATGDA